MLLKTKIATLAGIAALATGLAATGAAAQTAGTDGETPPQFGAPGGPDQLAQRRGRFGPGGPRGPGGPGGPGGPDLAELLDSNGDGEITQAEIDAMRRGRIAEFDTNGDGVLSLAEFEPLWIERSRPRMVDAFQHLDGNGDAEVDFDEFGGRLSRLVARLDSDGDGVIGADELPPRRGGRRGPPPAR